MRRHLVLTVSALIFSAHTALAQAPLAYDAVDLGTLGGGSTLAGVAMNANGDIVGSGRIADGTRHAFRWTQTGGLEDLGTFAGVDALATAINDAGDILGVYFDAQWGQHTFLLPSGGTMQLLPDLFYPSAIGANGWFTGMDNGSQAFRGTFGGAIEVLPTLWGIGSAINGAGDTAGHHWYTEPSDQGQAMAFRYTDADGLVELGTFGGPWSYAFNINSTATVVGGATNAAGLPHAFRAVVGQPLQDLGVLSNEPLSETTAYGVNDAGDVVGNAWSITDGNTPFRYTDDRGMVDLTPLIPLAARNNGRPYTALAINANKEILAQYFDPNGDLRTYLLRPRTDVTAPLMSALSADPALLSSPNGHMVPVTMSVSVSDEYDNNPSCRITRVIDSATPFSQQNPDVQIAGALTVNLRASRDRGHDRIYVVVVACTNYFNESSTRFTLVRVPRH
jgi:probable HAF family extracellular repeat protein